MSKARATLVVLAGALTALEPRAAAAAEPQEAASVERAVKAAYVYNFTKLVAWPAESPLARAPVFTIGVLGDDGFASTVEATVRARQAAERPLVVRRFGTVDEVVPCEVLFVGSMLAEQVPLLLRRLQGWPVLTVSDAEGFTSQGGVIGLFLEDNRIRFEIATGAAQAAGLQVGSKLLRLARPEPARACAGCVPGAAVGER